LRLATKPPPNGWLPLRLLVVLSFNLTWANWQGLHRNRHFRVAKLIVNSNPEAMKLSRRSSPLPACLRARLFDLWRPRAPPRPRRAPRTCPQHVPHQHTSWLRSGRREDELGNRRNAGLVRYIAGCEDERRFLAVQIGKLMLQLNQRVAGSSDIAGAAGTGTEGRRRRHHCTDQPSGVVPCRDSRSSTRSQPRSAKTR